MIKHNLKLTHFIHKHPLFSNWKHAFYNNCVFSYSDYNELWIPKNYHDREFWFLKDDTNDEANNAKDALETLSSATTTTKMDEQAVFMINNLVVKIESGIGNIPLLLMESSISMNVKDWSSKRMTMIGSLNLELAYYNAKLALWEPVIEPLAKTTDQIKSRFVFKKT